MFKTIAAFVFTFMILAGSPAFAASMRVVVLGDSLTAGYGLPPGDAFPAQLENALRLKGRDVLVENAGVSGDTSAGGLARLDGAIAGPVKPSLVIVELGANDMLRRMPPADMKANLHKILTKLKEQQIAVLLAGVNMPLFIPGFSNSTYADVYEELADAFDVPLYESFIDGIALKPQYNLEDRMHPNAAGVKIIVENIQEDVEDILYPPTGIKGWFR